METLVLGIITAVYALILIPTFFVWWMVLRAGKGE